MKQTDRNGIARLGPGDDLFGITVIAPEPRPQVIEPEPEKESTTVEQSLKSFTAPTSTKHGRLPWYADDFNEEEYLAKVMALYNAVHELFYEEAEGQAGYMLERERKKRRIELGRQLRSAPPTALADVFIRAMKDLSLC